METQRLVRGPGKRSGEEITVLLKAWSEGDKRAIETLAPKVIDEARMLARRSLAREPRQPSLQPTEVVHEAFIRLLARDSVSFSNRNQLFAALAELIRFVLTDHARRRKAQKRGAGQRALSIEDLGEPWQEGSAKDGLHCVTLAGERPEVFVTLHDALRALGELDPQQEKIVELKFFMGFNEREIAETLSISRRSVARKWQDARAWLFRELAEQTLTSTEE